MKTNILRKSLVAVTMLISLAAKAELNCGLSVEAEKGTDKYEKSVFLKPVQLDSPVTGFFFEDGTYLLSSEIQSSTMPDLKDGTIAFSISKSSNGGPNLFVGVLKRDANGNHSYSQKAIAGGLTENKSQFLIASGVFLYCMQK